MDGRDRIRAALSREGAPEIPAVICYEDLFVRDHWPELSAEPWWVRMVPDLERQVRWRRQVAEQIGQDWYELPVGPGRRERADVTIQEWDDTVYQVDRRTGCVWVVNPPTVGGWPRRALASVHPVNPPQTPEEVTEWISNQGDPEAVLADGRTDLAEQILADWGATLFPIAYVAGPLWSCYQMWGFEGMMTRIAEQPDLVQHAAACSAGRAVSSIRAAARLGALGIWIEDCMTDMVSPWHFAVLNLPFLRQLTDEMRACGMKSIHYFCGDPSGKWELLFDTGADALSLEESKKRFVIDIEDVVERVDGRMAVLGNLDAVRLLEHGTEEELRAEIARQLSAGRRNRSRFVMSLGSPVTPGTSVARVRLYCDLVHELGQ